MKDQILLFKKGARRFIDIHSEYQDHILTSRASICLGIFCDVCIYNNDLECFAPKVWNIGLARKWAEFILSDEFNMDYIELLHFENNLRKK